MQTNGRKCGGDPSGSETLRLRIAVAVADDGGWSAVGNCIYEADDEAVEAAVDYLPLESSPLHREVFFVTAELPSPPQVERNGHI